MKRLLFVVCYLIVYAGAAGWILYRLFTHADTPLVRNLLTFAPEYAIIFVIIVIMEYVRLTRFRRRLR